MLSPVDSNQARLSRVEVGGFVPESESFDLLGLVEGVAEQLLPRAREKFLALMVFVAPEIPAHLCGNPAGLERVLWNLLDNAIAFTEKGQVIVRVAIEQPADPPVDPRLRIGFQVQDTGMGIPAALLGHLRQEAVNGGPPGLPSAARGGLFEARDRVIGMGGAFDVSETSSRGTTVSFTLPLAPETTPGGATDAATGVADDAAAGAPPPPLRVLVVDDNETHREILLRYLGYWGIQSSSAGSGDEALTLLHQARAAEDPYRLAILDLAMPGMDGFALAHAIRRDPGLGSIDLILLTAFDERGQGEMALREGFVAYLTKPVKHASLLATIQRVVDKEVENGDGGG